MIEFENDNDNNEISEEDEVEEIKFNMADDEIDEWINELITLKEERKSINLQIDDSLYLKINYEEMGEE